MFSATVKSMYPKFSMAEKKIADYLLVNRGELADMTSYELAERLGVGQSTVIRFSKKMGYRMFGELIEDVQHAKGGVESEIEPEDAPFEVPNSESNTMGLSTRLSKATQGTTLMPPPAISIGHQPSFATDISIATSLPNTLETHLSNSGSRQ